MRENIRQAALRRWERYRAAQAATGAKTTAPPTTEPDPFKVVEFELVREPEQSEPDPEPPSKPQRPPSPWEEHTYATLLEQKNNGH